MAQSAAEIRQISVRRSCQIFNVSPTCYRYAAKNKEENKVVADSLIALSLCHRTCGFGLISLHLRNVQGKRWNHQWVYRVYCELRLNLRIKPEPLLVPERPEWRGKPAAIRSDNEPEYISAVVKDWADGHGIKLVFIQPGNSQQNEYIERFNRTMRYELLSPNLFGNIEGVQEAATQWAYAYNHDRPSMALNRRTPIQHLQTYLDNNHQPSTLTCR
jgi:Integrase core domain